MACTPYKSNIRMKKYSKISLKEFHKDDLAIAAVDLYIFVMGNGLNPVAFPPLWDGGSTYTMLQKR